MSLNLSAASLGDREPWTTAGIKLPRADRAGVVAATTAAPTWLHIGPGNIFRAFLAPAAQDLLDQGALTTGIVAVSTNDPSLVDRVYRPFDNRFLSVAAHGNGTLDTRVVESVVTSWFGDPHRSQDWEAVGTVFEAPSLQWVSLTITEKGYATTDGEGAMHPVLQRDLNEGPKAPRTVLGKLGSWLLRRYHAGGHPVSLVSMDNCARNGDRLREALATVSAGWASAGYAPAAFAAWLADPRAVSYPLTMIDKIVPGPTAPILAHLQALGLTGIAVETGTRGSALAPFVNAEASHYLFVEDDFPNGRPPLDRTRGVWFTTRDTVHRVETMKVTTCLNPLHTALAITGLLLGHDLVSQAAADPVINALIRKIGYDEGLPVAPDPGVVKPRDFLDTVLNERLPNPHLPDTTARIATDTSLKVGIRFGETLKAWQRSDHHHLKDLVGIPLVIAAWFRYLAGLDDQGQPLALSPDPRKDDLIAALGPMTLGGPVPDLGPFLRRDDLFGLDLVQAGLGPAIQSRYTRMLAAPGAVRTTLAEALGLD